MEMREAIGLRQVGVPQPNTGLNRQLPHQEIIHPSERELQVGHIMADQVAV